MESRCGQTQLHTPDANVILNIRTRNAGSEDLWASVYEQTGVYTVKSAYHALITHNDKRALEEGMMTETSEKDKQLWSSLWKLKLVPKVGEFWRRVMRVSCRWKAC